MCNPNKRLGKIQGIFVNSLLSIFFEYFFNFTFQGLLSKYPKKHEREIVRTSEFWHHLESKNWKVFLVRIIFKIEEVNFEVFIILWLTSVFNILK